MATKFFTGVPLAGPDPECVNGHGEAALLAVAAGGTNVPTPGSGAFEAGPGHPGPQAGRGRRTTVILTDPIRIGGHDAPNRLLFGPHETNLARGRAISDRHVAYYTRRARGGAGILVTEEASVHESDWPYERAPLASECGDGWRAVAAAVRGEGTGTLVIAALGHAGGQGSSAYSQRPLWAPSRVPEVNSREVPKWMEQDDIHAVVDGFGAAARSAAASGMDGVEVNAGQYSLVRQFCSGLTNLRDDAWGSDRLAFARAVLAATRAGLQGARDGEQAILGLRLSCDELAPWAGLTPEAAAEVAVELAPLVDYLVVVRGSIYSASATRPDFHSAASVQRRAVRDRSGPHFGTRAARSRSCCKARWSTRGGRRAARRRNVRPGRDDPGTDRRSRVGPEGRVGQDR